MKKRARFTAGLLAVLTAASLLSGCGSKGTAGTTGAPAESGTTGGTTTGNTTTAAAESTERKTLRVAIFDRASPGMVADDNFTTRYVQENFGKEYNVDVEFVPIPRSQEVDKLNMLMAANDAPDICFTYYGEIVYNYVKNGGLCDLTDLLPEYGPDLVKLLGDEVLEYGQYDGRQMAIPARRVNRGTLTTMIRKDWLDKLGLPVPTTTEEFYNTMVAFKEQDPGGLGDACIPYGLDYSAVDITWSSANLLDSFKTEMTDEELATLPEFGMPGFKEGVRFLNKMYNEGLISPNFALDKDSSQYQKDIASGKIGCFSNNTDYVWGRLDNLQKQLETTIPEGQFIPIDPFTNAEGKHPKRLYDPTGMRIIIPKTCKNPEIAIQYLNWMSDPDVLKDIQFGELGVHYMSDAEGYPTEIVPDDQVPEGMKKSGGDVGIILNGNDFGDPEINKKSMANKFPGYGEVYLQSEEMALVDGWMRPRIESPCESESTLGSTVKDKGNELFVLSVTCKPEEFDQVYDSMYEEYMSIGGQKILDEKLELWRAQQK